MASRYPIPVRKSTRLLSDITLMALLTVSVVVPFLSTSLLWISGALAAYILYSMRLSARHLTLTPSGLTIHLRLGHKHIPLHEIRSAQIIADIDLDWKLIPIPTLWGRNGNYRTPLFGQFTAYAGNPSLHMIRIETPHKAFLFACENPDDLLGHLPGDASQRSGRFPHIKKND